MDRKEDQKPICVGCNKHPDQIEEYILSAEDSDMSPDEYVRQEEGTYNKENAHFVCTDCYIKMGMPSKPYPDTWVAP